MPYNEYWSSAKDASLKIKKSILCTGIIQHINNIKFVDRLPLLFVNDRRNNSTASSILTVIGFLIVTTCASFRRASVTVCKIK